ncbi:MAG TPA: YihY/virulence factor BrkB family protein, partial [Vicinamibacterales bacterium]|nr:YihY/virulence factor BrkB family protein [Vicinamibacterales bacterium]
MVLRAAWLGVGDLYRSEAPTHAAAIAYYALLSLFPFLLLLFSVLGAVTADPGARDDVVAFVLRYFPRQFDFLTGQIDSLRGDRVSIGIGGGLALAYASLGVFNAISSAVNHVWGVEKRRSFIRHRLFSFVMMVSAGAMFLGAIVMVSIMRFAGTRLDGTLGTQLEWVARMSGLGADFAAIVMLILCVALVYHFVPNVKTSFRDVWPGAIVTGLLWRVAFALFSAYAVDPARWSVHGSVATVVVFLLWIYVSAV